MPGSAYNYRTIGGEVSAISAVPEPGSWLLLTTMGCAALLSKLPTRARLLALASRTGPSNTNATRQF